MGETAVNVVAVSTPQDAGWRWRIVNYAGEIIEESHRLFSTIRSAVAEGAERLQEMDVADVSRPSPHRTTPYLRGR